MKNVYDLEGNYWEWTAEAYSTDGRAGRVEVATMFPMVSSSQLAAGATALRPLRSATTVLEPDFM